jgi:hypothetical protein
MTQLIAELRGAWAAAERARLVRRGTVVAAPLLGAAAALSFVLARSEPEPGNEASAPRSLASEESTPSAQPARSAAMPSEPAPTHAAERAATSTDALCRASSQCRESGGCFAGPFGCVAGSREDCLKSDDCATYGRCTLTDDYCATRSDADCRHSLSCKNGGSCTYVAGHCEPGSDADCHQSKFCKESGACRGLQRGRTSMRRSEQAGLPALAHLSRNGGLYTEQQVRRRDDGVLREQRSRLPRERALQSQG